MITRKITYCLLGSLTLILVAGCSAEKNTSLSRNYHGLTSHYNIYFNGYESFLRGVEKCEDAFVDDYSKILSLFTYVDENIAKQIAPEMDLAIQKAYKIITLHSITAKPEMETDEMTDDERAFYNQPEYNRWVDDSYLLMAKAQFYKHDYHIALNTLKLLISEALDEETRMEAYIWLARTNIELEEYKEAERILTFIADEQPVKEKMAVEYHATYAHYFLKQEEYERAIPHLTLVVDRVRRKKDKQRYTFVLAQLHEETGDFVVASDLYKDVIRMNPPYEMTFNARINKAGSFDVTREDSEEIKKDLKKLLRDKKNIDYQDQIYYAYGKIAYKENRIEEAIDYYKKSAASSISNSFHKGQSYLEVADIYFSQLDYQHAQAYYDSAVAFLAQDYPHLDQIRTKSQNLTELVKYINIVELEDSLQMVVGLSDQDKFSLVDGIIRELNEKEQLEREEQIERQYNTMNYYENERRFRNDIQREGKWYFYNPSALSFGRNEFRLKWGERRLEDNWRRANKSTVSFVAFTSESNQANPDVTGDNLGTSDVKSREYYLKDLPVNDSLLKISDTKIADALYNIGRIYKDDFNDFKRSITTYEDLNHRYPANEYQLSSYYYLYELNKNLPDRQRENHYKNLILSQYPESEYAKIISDPEYFDKLKAEERQVVTLYEETYKIYLNKEYQQAIERCNYADSAYAGDELLPKFRLLKALSIGRTQDVRAFKNALTELSEAFPDSREKEKANEIAAFLDRTLPVLKEEEEVIEAQEIYAYNDSAVHYYLLVVNRFQVNVNQLIFNIINYNLDHYSQVDFETGGEMLNDTLHIITVKSFLTLSDAQDYSEKIILEESVINELQQGDYYSFIISDENFTTLKNDKSVSKYDKFFKMKYLR